MDIAGIVTSLVGSSISSLSSILPLDVMFFVAFFSFMYDIIDLRPQEGIKSFKFITTTFYRIYFIWRFMFGVLAAIIISSMGVTENPIMLAFVAVITSVTTLQNFTLKASGVETANFYDLFQRYKDSMVAEMGKRESEARTREEFEITSKVGKRDINTLRGTLKMIYSNKGLTQEKIEERMKYMKDMSGGDEKTERLFLANEITQQSIQHAKILIEDTPLT